MSFSSGYFNNDGAGLGTVGKVIQLNGYGGSLTSTTPQNLMNLTVTRGYWVGELRISVAGTTSTVVSSLVVETTLEGSPVLPHTILLKQTLPDTGEYTFLVPVTFVTVFPFEDEITIAIRGVFASTMTVSSYLQLIQVA